jgi:hypothetical protein
MLHMVLNRMEAIEDWNYTPAGMNVCHQRPQLRELRSWFVTISL